VCRGVDRIFPQGEGAKPYVLPSPPLPSPVSGGPRKILKFYIAVGEFSPIFLARNWVCR